MVRKYDMKRKLLFLLAIASLILVLLCSCNFGGNTGEEGGPGEELPENLIYNTSSPLFVIREQGFDEELFLEILGELEGVRTGVVNLAATDSEPHEHEIVIGDTDRAISKTARQKLDRLDRNSESDRGILFYSDGSSLAIVFDNDPDGVTARLTVDYFIENCVKDELILKEGVIYKTTFDLIDDYGASVDEAYKNEMWALMEETVGGTVGKNLVNAMKQFYSIYSSDMLIWLADLFEPGICVCNGLYGETECRGTAYCGTAGFYYSNSARDTAGYLPDVETTYQALMLLNSTGVTRVVGGWQNMIDEETLLRIADFIRSIQVEDGNFIHPQWAELELGISRKSRDLKWATELLEMIGVRPYYTTPTGIPGIGAPKAVSYCCAPLGGSAVTAAASVVKATAHLPELEDDVSFKAYLESLNIRYRSYAGGNQIASLLGQITARDAELKKEGKDYRLIDILIDFLNENRNTVTGTWDHTPVTDPSYSIYEGVNGLMKIASSYNVAEVAMPYASEACESAIAAITASETVGEVVDVYNPWHALSLIFGNLTGYGGEEGELLTGQLRQRLYEAAPEVLSATSERALLFSKAGGSFSYNKDSSAAYSQGCPAAVLNSKEGDVNGTVLGSSGLLDYVYSALGLKNCKVPLFGETERILFMEELRSLEPGKKPPEDLSYDVETFEGDVVGEEPSGRDVTYKEITHDQSVYVVERDDGQGKALEVNSKYFVNNSDSVTVDCRSTSNLAKTFVFEGDFRVLSTDRYYSVQIKMSAAYMFALKWEDNRITLWECSSSSNSKSLNTKFDPTVALGEWFRVRVEYYYGDADSVRIKFYFDNLADEEEMKLIAVTDNFYDEKGYKLNGTGTPSAIYDNTLIYVLSDASVRMQMDNLASYKTNDSYEPYTDKTAPLSFNVDSPDTERVSFDYEDGSVPGGFRDIKGTATVVESGGNKVLKLSDHTVTSGATIPLNVRTAGATATVFESRVQLSSLDAGKNALIVTATENTGNVIGFCFRVSNDGSYAETYEYSGERGALLPDAKIPTDRLVTVRIDYYADEDVALVYVEGEFVGASGTHYTGGTSRLPARISISVPSGAAVLLDDTVAERSRLDYSEATSPKRDSVIHDLEGDTSLLTLSGNATVVTDGSNKLLKLSSTGRRAGVTIPVNKRSDISSVLILETELTVSNAKTNGVTHYINFKDSLGNTVHSLAIAKGATAVGIYEVGLEGVKSHPIVTVDQSKSTNIEIRYYPDQKTTYIYKNQELAAMTNIISSAEYYGNAVDSVEICSDEAGAILCLDDIRAETLYEAFTLVKPDAGVNPESGDITFEESSTGSLPGHLHLVLNSDDASLKIEENTDKNGDLSNVAVFVTGLENNDSIGVKAEEDLSVYSTVVFEADFRIETNRVGPAYQLFFTKGSQSADDVVYLIYLTMGSDGKLTLADYSQASQSAAVSRSNILADGINAKVWNSIRVEIFKGSKESVRMRISLNGEVVFVSDNYFGYNMSTPDVYPAPHSEVTKVYFYSFLDTKGTMYIDNMHLYGENTVCTDPVGAK